MWKPDSSAKRESGCKPFVPTEAVQSDYCMHCRNFAVQSDCRTCNYNILTSSKNSRLHYLPDFVKGWVVTKQLCRDLYECNKTLDECNHQRCKSCTHWLHCCKRCTHGYLFKCPEIAKDQAAAPQRFMYLLCLGLGSADHYYLYLVLGAYCPGQGHLVPGLRVREDS